MSNELQEKLLIANRDAEELVDWRIEAEAAQGGDHQSTMFTIGGLLTQDGLFVVPDIDRLRT